MTSVQNIVKEVLGETFPDVLQGVTQKIALIAGNAYSPQSQQNLPPSHPFRSEKG